MFIFNDSYSTDAINLLQELRDNGSITVLLITMAC
jgi:hypothetical protein